MRLAVALLAAAALLLQSDLRADPLCSGLHVLVVGDSQACAVGPHLQRIAAIDASKVDVACKVGSHVSYWNDGRFQEVVEHMDGMPDAVVIFLGTNDHASSRAPDVRRILSTVKDHNLPCVWVGPTDVGGKQATVNAPLGQAVQPTCGYFDTSVAQIALGPDRVHPTAQGIAKWSQLVWNCLRMSVLFGK